MEIKHHLAFSAERHPELVAHLNRTFANWKRGEIVSTFDVLESDFRWGFIGPYCAEHGIPALAETIFTREELAAASWLQVRSNWHWSYPQPEDGYRDVTYAPGFCTHCGSGKTQTAPFRMKSPPKFGKRHFLSLNWVYDELFTDDAAAAALDTLSIAAGEVQNRTGKTVLKGVRQVLIPELLPPAFLPDARSVRKTTVCPACGRTKYVTSGIGMLRFRREAFEDAPPIVKTHEVFGDGALACRRLLVSQAVCRKLTAEKLDGGLVFAPVELV